MFLQPQKAQLTASLSCVLYLQSSLNFVDSRVTEEAKRSSVLLCLHDLNLYAIDYWLDHLLALSKSLVSYPDRCELEPLLRSLERLTEMHQIIAASQGSDLHEAEEQDYRQQGQHWQLFGMSQAARSLLNRVLVHQQTVSSEDHPPKEPHCMPAALQDSSSLIVVSPANDPNANHQYPLLFSQIRNRYRSIVEELMETEEANDQTLSAFKLRQASGAFLCRYPGCSRATQGFHSSVLREKHEESHRPRFQCTHAACGLLGTTFNSQAAMKKHNARYHDEDNTASVPNSLTRKPRCLHEDRTLFTLSDSKMKRKAEGSNFHEEHSGSLQASVKGQTTLASLESWQSASERFMGTSMLLTNGAEEQIDRTMSDVYLDSLPNPRLAPTTSSMQSRQQAARNTESPQSSAISKLQEAANKHRSMARSASPVSNTAHHASPFRESSEFAVEMFASSPSSPANFTRLTPTAQLGQQRTWNRYSSLLNSPKIVRPKEAHLDFGNIEDTEMSLTYSLKTTNNPDTSSPSIPHISDPGSSNMVLPALSQSPPQRPTALDPIESLFKNQSSSSSSTFRTLLDRG